MSARRRVAITGLGLVTPVGNDVAGTEFSMEALLDSSKPVSGTLGRFGRFIEVATV